MRILHTIPGFGVKSGGTTTCTYDLLSAMRRQETDVEVVTIESPDPSDKLVGNGEKWINVLPYDYVTPFAYSHNLKAYLTSSEFDVYHTNGLWMYANHATCSQAYRKGKPYIITPHGMLYPQALARSAWKKKLMLAACFNRDIKRADILHATCMPEYQYIRDLGLVNPVAVIPNPVPPPDYISEVRNVKKSARVGFLGRLHPRKHVHTIIEAWKKLNPVGAQLLIMGAGDPGYEKYLKELARDTTSIEFAGFVAGREKFERLASLTALVVASDFENFGMIVTEALSVGTPVIASKGTPWQSLEDERCGWGVDNDVNTLADTIAHALSLSEDEVREMGRRGSCLVEEKYLDSNVAAMMGELYRYVGGEGPRPNFVLD